MRAVDTNVLVRIIAEDDAHQLDAALSYIKIGAWVSILALTETIWVLRDVYGRGAEELIGVLETLLGHESLVIQDSDAVSRALDLFRSRPSLGFSDCLMLELARKHGNLPLGTFDCNLGKLPGAQRL